MDRLCKQYENQNVFNDFHKISQHHFAKISEVRPKVHEHFLKTLTSVTQSQTLFIRCDIITPKVMTILFQLNFNEDRFIVFIS